MALASWGMGGGWHRSHHLPFRERQETHERLLGRMRYSVPRWRRPGMTSSGHTKSVTGVASYGVAGVLRGLRHLAPREPLSHPVEPIHPHCLWLGDWTLAIYDT